MGFIAMACCASFAAEEANSKLSGVFSALSLPISPEAWVIDSPAELAAKLEASELGKGPRLTTKKPQQPQLMTMKLKQPILLPDGIRRVGVWMYTNSIFRKESRHAPLRFLLHDAQGVRFSYALYGSSPVPNSWNYVECPRLRGGELGRLDETMILVEGGKQHHLPVEPLSFDGLELQISASKHLPENLVVELGELGADGIHREASRFYWQSDLGQRYLFGDMPFAEKPFVMAGDLLSTKGDYTIKWQVRKELFGHPIAQGEWQLPGYQPTAQASFQRLTLPLASRGQYWASFSIGENAGRAARTVETRIKIIRGDSAEPATLSPEIRPVGSLIVVNPQRQTQIYEPGELNTCIIRVWKPQIANATALKLMAKKTYYASNAEQEESFPVAFSPDKEYAEIPLPLTFTDKPPMLQLDLRLLSGTQVLDSLTQRIGQRRIPEVAPWTNRDKVAQWDDIFEKGHHLLSCAEWGSVYSVDTDLSKFEEWVLDVKKQNVNTIELFPRWKEIEPMPGVFWWDQVDQRLALIARHGLKAMINLDCSSVPDWMEEESQADEEGMVNGLWGSGKNDVLKSPNSPKLRQYYGEYLTTLALRYRNNPDVIAYSSLSIYFDHFWADHPWTGQYVDYSEAARLGFRSYMRDVKKLTISELAKRWNKPGLTAWEAVELPRTDLFLGLATIDRPDPRPEWQDFIDFRVWIRDDFQQRFVAGTIRKYDDRRPIGFHGLVLDEKTAKANQIYLCAGSSEGSLDNYRQPYNLPKRAESIQMLYHSAYYTAICMSNLLAQNNLNVQHFWPYRWRWDNGPGEQDMLGTHALAGWLALFQGDLGVATPVHAQATGPAPVFGYLFSRASILNGVRSFHFSRLDDYKMLLEHATDVPHKTIEEDVSPDHLRRLPCVIVDPTARILPTETVDNLVAYVQNGGKLVLAPTSGRYTLNPAEGDHVLRKRLGLVLPQTAWKMAAEYAQPGEYRPYYPFAVTGKGTPGEQSLAEPGQTAVTTANGTGIFSSGRSLVFRLGSYTMYNRDTWGDWAHMLPFFIYGRYQDNKIADGRVLATWNDGGIAASLHNVGKGEVLCLWGTPDWYNWRDALGDLAAWAGPAAEADGTPVQQPYSVSPEGFKGYLVRHNETRWAVIRNESTGWTSLYDVRDEEGKKRRDSTPRNKGVIKVPGLSAQKYRVQDLTPLLSQGFDQTMTSEQLANEGIVVELIPCETRIFRLDPVK